MEFTVVLYRLYLYPFESGCGADSGSLRSLQLFSGKDHELSGNWVGYRECHIQPDWLLIYYIENDVLVLTLARTGTHSDLFK